MFKVNQNHETVINQVLNFIESSEIILSFEVVEKASETVLVVKTNEGTLEYTVKGNDQMNRMKKLLSNMQAVASEVFNGKYDKWIAEAV